MAVAILTVSVTVEVSVAVKNWTSVVVVETAVTATICCVTVETSFSMLVVTVDMVEVSPATVVVFLITSVDGVGWMM